jgi:hypothetical protein
VAQSGATWCSVMYVDRDGSESAVGDLSRISSDIMCSLRRQDLRVVSTGCCCPPLPLTPMLMTPANYASSSGTETLHHQGQRHFHLPAGRSGLEGMDLGLAIQALVARGCHSEEGLWACADRELWTRD